MNTSSQCIRTSPENKFEKDDGGDFISNLHNSVLSHILSRLPTKDAVRTSILSKDWEFKWTCMYNFNLTCELYDGEARLTFSNFVDRVVLLCQGITSFSIKSEMDGCPSRLKTWVLTALSRRVERFEIECFTPGFQNAIEFPITLLNSTSLRKLKLHTRCIFKNFDAKTCFSSLTSLSLCAVQFLNESSELKTISFTFPVLATLDISHCSWMNVEYVEISAPVLTSLSYLASHYFGAMTYVIKILAPKLETFKTRGRIPENIVVDGSQVVSAYLHNSNSIDVEMIKKDGAQVGKLLDRFSSLEKLSLSSYMIKALSSGGFSLCFNQLRRLIAAVPNWDNIYVLDQNRYNNVEALFRLLHAAPALKYLSMSVCFRKHNTDFTYGGTESLPSCLVFELEEIEIKNFSTSKEYHYELVNCLLKNGGALKKLSFKGRLRDEERRKIVEHISKIPRRQACITIFFSEPDETILLT